MTLYDDIMQHLAPPTVLPPMTVNIDPLRRMLQQWELRSAWATYVHEFYPTADHVAVDLSSEYNDEGGYYNVINHITVYDATDREITGYLPDDRIDEFQEGRYELPVPESYPDAERIDLRLSCPLTQYSRDYLIMQLSKTHDALVALPESCFGPSL